MRGNTRVAFMTKSEKKKELKKSLLSLFVPLSAEIIYKFENDKGFVYFQFTFQAINMLRRRCRNCPVPFCPSKVLVKLSNHLSQVHGLSQLERKYWLQFAKLQDAKMIRVYHNESSTKTIHLQISVYTQY